MDIGVKQIIVKELEMYKEMLPFKPFDVTGYLRFNSEKCDIRFGNGSSIEDGPYVFFSYDC